MLISTLEDERNYIMFYEFQSLDWVDVDFDVDINLDIHNSRMFQSLDWVDVDFDVALSLAKKSARAVSIPRLG